ncbi:MAG: hypothetical protein WCJ59_00840 [bacterium]
MQDGAALRAADPGCRMGDIKIFKEGLEEAYMFVVDIDLMTNIIYL